MCNKLELFHFAESVWTLISLNGTVIDLVSSLKLQGVNFDTKFTWQCHISAIVGRLSGIIAIIYELGNTVGYNWLI